VTIPSEVRSRLDVKVGDTLLVEFDEGSGLIKLHVPKRGSRKTARLGRDVTPEGVEASIDRGMTECLRR